MAEGYVYILSNESMPGIVKIGKTTRSVEARASELHQTGVPTPFSIENQVFSPNCCELERIVHQSLIACRVHQAREFFYIDAARATMILNGAHKEQVVCLLDTYMPGHLPVEAEMIVDDGMIYEAADLLSEHPFVIVGAISELTQSEIADLHARHKRLVELRVAALAVLTAAQ